MGVPDSVDVVLRARGLAPGASGFAEHKAGQLIKQLLEEGMIRSDSPKGPVRLGFPAHAISYLFSKMVPVR